MAISTEAKVGLMIFISLVIIASMTFTVSKISLFRRPGDKLKITFQDTGGLRIYDDVRIAGVVVGSVSEIYLEGDHAVVVIQLKPDFHIRSGAKAIINSVGLLGEVFISVTQGPENAQILTESSAPITSEQTIRVDQLMANLNEFVNKAKDAMNFNLRQVIMNTEELISSLNSMINENRANIRDIADNLKTFSKGLSDTEREFNAKLLGILGNIDQYTQLLNNKTAALADSMINTTKNLDKVIDKNGDQLSKFISDLDAILPELNKVVKSMSNTMNKIESVATRIEKGEGTVGKLTRDTELYDNLNGVVRDMKGMTSSMERITSRVEKGEGTIGKLATDSQLYDNMNETMKNVKEIVGKVSEIKTYWGYRLDYRFLKTETQKEFRNAFSFKIEPREGKYYLLELNDIGGKDRISVEIGKSVYSWLSLRAGIIESSGGIGVDYHLLKDRFSVGVSTFDFGRVSKPQLRIVGDLKLNKNISLNLGADDLLLDKSYYVGLQIMVEDKDIKYLLGFMPFVK